MIVCSVIAGDAISGEFAVIVNTSNDYKSDEKDMSETVRQLYLKKRSAWPNKTDAKAFARSIDSPEQKAFVESVLGITQTALDEHWISLKSRSGQTGPREVGSDVIVIKFVQKYPGAFSVIKADIARSSDGVKVLFTFP